MESEALTICVERANTHYQKQIYASSFWYFFTQCTLTFYPRKDLFIVRILFKIFSSKFFPKTYNYFGLIGVIGQISWIIYFNWADSAGTTRTLQPKSTIMIWSNLALQTNKHIGSLCNYLWGVLNKVTKLCEISTQCLLILVQLL